MNHPFTIIKRVFYGVWCLFYSLEYNNQKQKQCILVAYVLPVEVIELIN